MNMHLILIFFTCLFFTSFFYTANTNVLEVEDEGSFSYQIGAPNGPQNWGNNPNWTLCGTGRKQSPINIISADSIVRPSLGVIHTHYIPAPAVIKNRGHDISVEWVGDAGGIIIHGTEFKLLQCHWHTPSEHTINGNSYAMELHMVHASLQKDLAVIGILYRLEQPDPFLAQIQPFIGSATMNGSDIGVVNPSDIQIRGKEYYRYNGSLTVPPCSQNVTWTLFKCVKTVSMEQITALRNAIHDGNIGNARPVQPLNGRTIYLYRAPPPPHY